MDPAPVTARDVVIPVSPVSPVRAVLNAGDVETEYLRGGQGRVVILVVTRELRHPLFVALAQGCRVIMPVATTPVVEPLDGSGWAGWLHDFLEGLGATAVALVVADPACDEAVQFVEEHPTQIERLVLLTSRPQVSGANAHDALVLDPGSTDSVVTDVAAYLLGTPVRLSS